MIKFKIQGQAVQVENVDVEVTAWLGTDMDGGLSLYLGDVKNIQTPFFLGAKTGVVYRRTLDKTAAMAMGLSLNQDNIIRDSRDAS